MKKRFDDLKFTDDFIFCEVLRRKPHIAGGIISRVLGEEIGKIVLVEDQKSEKHHYDNRGVRFDVYLKDDANTVYNIEMQAKKERDLPKRSRYYHSMLDMAQLKEGARYNLLRKTIVIFICGYKLDMNKDMPIYKYEMLCLDDLQDPLNDGNITLIVNSYCECEGLEPEIKAFLEYVKSGKLSLGDKLIEDIENEINLIKTLETCEVRYMSFEEKIEDAIEEGRLEGLEEGIEKGIKQGIEQGLAEGALSKLVSLVEKKLLDVKVAAEEAGMSVEEFEKLLSKKD